MTLKVYLLEKSGGGYEDSYSYIVDVYTSNELAGEARKQLLKIQRKEHAQRVFCGQCKLCSGIGLKEYTAREVRIKRRCDKASPIIYEEYGGYVECANNKVNDVDIYGDPHFKIIEKELIDTVVAKAALQ